MKETSQKLIEWIENVGAVMTEELPAFVKEVCLFGFWKGLVMTCLLSVFFFIVFAFMVYLLRKGMNLEDSGYEGSIFIFWSAVMAIGCVLLFLCIYFQIEGCLKAYCAPRLYVIDMLIRK